MATITIDVPDEERRWDGILNFLKKSNNWLIIMFEYYDNDDYCTWEFKYIKSPKWWIYLWWWIDFWLWIGRISTDEEIFEKTKEWWAYHERWITICDIVSTDK